MKNILYAPWRGDYTESVHGKDETTPKEGCVFCAQFAQPDKDKQHYILKRFDHCVVMMNLYPYNAGHLLVLPYQHVGSLEQLSQEERTEIMEVITQTTKILKEVIRAHGFNIGLNQGKAAGAGIPSHLHFHVLPRWNGDTNFLPTLAQAKTISLDLSQLYEQLYAQYNNIKLE